MLDIESLLNQVKGFMASLSGGDSAMIVVYIAIALVAMSIIGFVLKTIRKLITWGLVLGLLYLFSVNNFDVEATLHHLNDILSNYKNHLPRF